jgi:hypothetical protein
MIHNRLVAMRRALIRASKTCGASNDWSYIDELPHIRKLPAISFRSRMYRARNAYGNIASRVSCTDRILRAYISGVECAISLGTLFLLFAIIAAGMSIPLTIWPALAKTRSKYCPVLQPRSI